MLGDTARAAALGGKGENWIASIRAYLSNQATLVDDTDKEQTSRKTKALLANGTF
jgi:hypothetical protein